MTVNTRDTIPETYESAAADHTKEYLKACNDGDEDRCLSIARTCEEQGILAALVMVKLNRGMQRLFVEDMKRVAGDQPEE